MYKLLVNTLLLICPYWLFCQSAPRVPMPVQQVLKKAKSRAELEKAIRYYTAKKDPLKLQALFFLMANMDIHQSANYYWIDNTNKKVNYDELKYASYDAALTAFEQVKAKTPGIHPRIVYYKDMDTITASLLIENIEESFKAWQSPYSRHLGFNEFCEYLLPYRIGIEPLQQWRSRYVEQFAWYKDSTKGLPLLDALNKTGTLFRKWFTPTNRKETRREPLPRLGALQLLTRAKGGCEDIADLQTYMLRSQGIPISLDFVPYWATSSGSHFFNSVHDKKGQTYMYDPVLIMPQNDFERIERMRLVREPGKVIRLTYAKQKNALAEQLDSNLIPPGFMRASNYLDVTNQYWKTADVTCTVNKLPGADSIAYANVFNFGTWRPIWWGRIRNNSVGFNNMSKGAVFLPSVYKNGKHVAIGYPVVLGNEGQTVLQPDMSHLRSVRITWQKNYLVFRPGKRYKLYYWNSQWKLIGEQVAKIDTEELVFDKVPEKALLLLIPEYTEHKERPFTISRDGKRQWW